MLQPLVDLLRQCHGVGRDNKAADAFPVERLAHFLGKERGPKPLDGRQRAQVLALFGPGGPGLGNARPQGVAALACGQRQLGGVGGEPLGFAAQRAAPALVRALRKGAQGFGGGQGPFGQVVYRRVEHAGVGCEEGGFFAALVPLEFVLQQLPGVGVQKSAGLVLVRTKERAHGLGQLRGGEAGLLVRVGHANQRERHGGPMHLGKTVELLAHLLVAGQRRVVGDAGFLQQTRHHVLPQGLQPLAHLGLHGLGQGTGPAGRHHGHKAVGQCGSKQGVAVGVALHPVAVAKQLGGQAALVPQPQIDLRHAAQAREQNGVGAELFGHDTHGLPGQACQQVRAGPQVFHLARAGDEGLHRSDGEGQQRDFTLQVGGKGASEGAGQVEVVPDGVVGHAGVGGQELPQLAELAVVVALVHFGRKAPQGEQGLLPVQRLARGLAFQRGQQTGVVVEAALLDVVEIAVAQAAVLAQIELVSGQRVDQRGCVGPADLGPRRDLECLDLAFLGGNGDLLHRPLWPVCCCSPPVGALHVAVHGGGDAFLEHGAHQGFVVVGVHRFRADGVKTQQTRQRQAGPFFMAFGVAQQYQGLLGRVVQASGKFGLPEGGVVGGHGRHSQAGTRVNCGSLSRCRCTVFHTAWMAARWGWNTGGGRQGTWNTTPTTCWGLSAAGRTLKRRLLGRRALPPQLLTLWLVTG